MTYKQNQRKNALEYAELVKSWGYHVQIAESGTYGIATANGLDTDHVISFAAENLLGISVSGKHKPSRGCGSGWRHDETPYDKESFNKFYNAPIPYWVGHETGEKTTLKNYLEFYQRSSQYRPL